MTTTDTNADQVNAAGALLAILTTHPSLPAARVQLQPMPVPGTYEWAWGLYVALQDDLSEFEQWRQALRLDPVRVEHKHHDTSAWLTVTGTHSSVPVALLGFYAFDTDAER